MMDSLQFKMDSLQFKMENGKAVYVGNRQLQELNQSSQEYFEWSQFSMVLSQATRICLRRNNISNHSLLSELLLQSSQGQHVLLKSFNAFSKSVLGRVCFLHNFLKIFPVDSTKNGQDYYQLLKLLCSDFPREIVFRAMSVVHQTEDCMHKSIDCTSAASALYISFIYMEYLDALMGANSEGTVQSPTHSTVSLQKLTKLVCTTDQKIPKYFQKPPLQIMAQIVLEILNESAPQREGLTFVTEESFEKYVLDRVESSNVTVAFQEVLHRLVQSPEHILLVESNLEMFQNSATWATQAHKLLTLKQPSQAPLNVKKSSKGKR